MATFSENQVRHLYVVNSIGSTVASNAAAGAGAFISDTAKTNVRLSYMGADGLVRSDLIGIPNIISAKAVDADTMKQDLKSNLIALASTVNSGAPVSGQDYIIRIAIRPYIGLSEEDVYFKFGMVHAYAGMTASDFYKTLAISLAKNFFREAVPLLAFQLKTSNSSVDVTATTSASSLTGTYTGVLINEVAQPWRLGIFSQSPVNFTITFDTITVSGDEVIWGTNTAQTAIGTINNGHKIADLEYFCMGERGDMYRRTGFPNNFETPYLVVPTTAYNLLDVQYYYEGDNQYVQKSEKTLTLAVPKVGATNSVSNVLMNSVITNFNTATGLTVPALSIA